MNPQKVMEKRSPGILRYSLDKAHAGTLRRQYIAWRSEQDPPLPIRCDNPDCKFHAEPLVWNGIPFDPILNHVDGVNSDNRPEKLRFLCPNCDSQQRTRGGRNKGRVIKSSGGFARVADDGKKHHTLVAETGYFDFSAFMEKKIANDLMARFESFTPQNFSVVSYFICARIIRHSLRSLHLNTKEMQEVIQTFNLSLQASYGGLPQGSVHLDAEEIDLLRKVDELHGFDFVEPVIAAHKFQDFPSLEELEILSRKILTFANEVHSLRS